MEQEQLSILAADIREQHKKIDVVYRKIALRKKSYAKDPVALESLAYQLHNLYSAFEDLFRIVANHFENQISDQTGWHKELLSRMKMQIEGIRPALISEPAYELLNELRGFRHVFRHAYGYELEPEKIKIVLKKALALKKIYKKDTAGFLEQLKAKNKQKF
jgi:uncharacterized protein YutE (UPF0331/DUF86 family)